MNNSETKPFGDPKRAKVLVIGHDPRLQDINTIAEHCFFTDYFFKSIPKSSAELRKYNLAASLFSYLGWLTSYKYTAQDYYITNLCNQALPHAPKNRIVLIPDTIAQDGINQILTTIQRSNFELILPMSQQVNYWLQHYGFYNSSSSYIEASEPKDKGIKNNYYEPKGKAPFLRICGKQFAHKDIPVIPILHVKQYPLKGSIKANYLPLLQNGIEIVKMIL
jgi:hypothetical protein